MPEPKPTEASIQAAKEIIFDPEFYNETHPYREELVNAVALGIDNAKSETRQEVRRLLIDADSTLSLLYYRAGQSIPWVGLGGEGFKKETYELFQKIRRSYDAS